MPSDPSTGAIDSERVTDADPAVDAEPPTDDTEADPPAAADSPADDGNRPDRGEAAEDSPPPDDTDAGPPPDADSPAGDGNRPDRGEAAEDSPPPDDTDAEPPTDDTDADPPAAADVDPPADDTETDPPPAGDGDRPDRGEAEDSPPTDDTETEPPADADSPPTDDTGDEPPADDPDAGPPPGADAEPPPDDAEDDAEEDAREHTLVQDLFENPSNWAIWPAIGILRWALRNTPGEPRRLIYRSLPSLAFKPNEIHSVILKDDSVDVTLTAPGIASPGSPLPLSDIARIVKDYRPPGRGAISAWLDGPIDLLMQVLETAQMRSNAAFALATGGWVDSIYKAAALVGHTAPLQAQPGHRLAEQPGADPEGAVALAALFVGNPSAAGLATLIYAFTGLPARVEEFAGARIRTQRPAIVGGPLMRVLGRFSDRPEAGIDVIIEGGSDEGAGRWAQDPERSASLRLLCERYIGSNGIIVRLYLELDAGNVEEATLDNATLGGMAMLRAEPVEPSDGPPSEPGPVRLPLLA